jgi:hypothetical protein
MSRAATTETDGSPTANVGLGGEQAGKATRDAAERNLELVAITRATDKSDKEEMT